MTTAINDYLLERKEVASIEALTYRLILIEDYIDNLGIADTLFCEQIDEDWISKFRKWAKNTPVIRANGKQTQRRSGGIEGSVRALQSAINAKANRGDILRGANFKCIKFNEVSITPIFRADVPKLAQMFAYALEKTTDGRPRTNLLRFMQASLATWGRPDAVYDLSTDPERRQWIKEAQVVSLNPTGRKQTRKRRATIPVPARFAQLLNACDGFYVPVKSIKTAWSGMAKSLGLPGDGEAGEKLIRRSIAHLVRSRIGEEHWAQGQMMLGHRGTSISDLYALPDPANLGLAMAATAGIIDEIEMLVPGAFSRHCTGLAPDIKGVLHAKNG